MNNLELGNLWEKILENTKEKIPPAIWERVISTGLFPYSMDGDELKLYAMHDFIKNLVHGHGELISILNETVSTILQRPITIRIIDENSMEEPDSFSLPTNEEEEISTGQQPPVPPVVKEPKKSSEPKARITGPTTAEALNAVYEEPIVINTPVTSSYVPSQESLFAEEDTYTTQNMHEHSLTNFEAYEHDCKLNALYTFDTFITGNSNRIAVAAAMNVAANPAISYNPLFIYGNSGLGKTHLMHAIGHKILETNPHMRILCISSEKFMNDMIASIQYNKPESFREIYRNVDVLLVDDIQFIQSKPSTQMEFFHTFNDLYDAKKQIVLTSDVLPCDMNEMEDRLRSRFEGGYVVSIDPPDLETRIAILRAKAKEERAKNPALRIEDDAITLIASKIHNNIRSMEGAFNKVINTANIMNQIVDQHFTYEVIKDMIGPNATRQLNIEVIQESVSEYFHLKMEDLLGQKRKKHLVYPRQIAMYLCRELIKASFPAIADSFGKKDHTTIIHAYDKIANDRKTIEDTSVKIENIIKILKKKCG